jgi:hypothetical protein
VVGATWRLSLGAQLRIAAVTQVETMRDRAFTTNCITPP